MSHDLYETEVRARVHELEEKFPDKSFAFRQGLFWRGLSDKAKRLMADNVYISLSRVRTASDIPKPKPPSADVIRLTRD